MFQQTFNKPNVRLVTNRIEEITEAGIRTDIGDHHELDTIIYATGREAFCILGLTQWYKNGLGNWKIVRQLIW